MSCRYFRKSYNNDIGGVNDACLKREARRIERHLLLKINLSACLLS